MGTLLNDEFYTEFRGMCETGSGLFLPRASSGVSLLLLPRSFVSDGLGAFWAQQHAWICFCLQRRVHDLKNPFNFRFVGGLSLPMFFQSFRSPTPSGNLP